jgi:hypothetical protein
MLRLLVLLLVLANAGYWAWTHGWLPAGWLPPPADGEHEREPARLAAQVRPETIELLGEGEARRLARSLCLQAGPFDEAQWPAAEAAALRAGLGSVNWLRVPAEPPATGHWIRVPEADADMQLRLQGTPDPDLGAGFSPCP